MVSAIYVFLLKVFVLWVMVVIYHDLSILLLDLSGEIMKINREYGNYFHVRELSRHWRQDVALFSHENFVLSNELIKVELAP